MKDRARYYEAIVSIDREIIHAEVVKVEARDETEDYVRHGVVSAMFNTIYAPDISGTWNRVTALREKIDQSKVPRPASYLQATDGYGSVGLGIRPLPAIEGWSRYESQMALRDNSKDTRIFDNALNTAQDFHH